MKNIRIIYLILFLSSCSVYQDWKPHSSIDLGQGTPIGLTILQNDLYLSDGNHQQLQVVDLGSGEIRTVKGFDRPMHLESDEGTVWVPEYTASRVGSCCAGMIDSILNDIDTPASISKQKNKYAIAEFYRNEITYFNGTKTLKIGQKGNANGQFSYPTDVQLFGDQIYVADAYNHRVQVFDTLGNWLKTLAYAQGINTAAGIYVNQEAIYVTDFENSRVLVFDHQNQLLQTISQGLNKPTDVLEHDNRLYITNFGGNNVSVLSRK